MADTVMDPEVREASLRAELAGLENSPARPAKDRRIAEVREALGEFEDTSDKAPRERAVTKKAGA